MPKCFFLSILLLFISSTLKAQKGRNQVNLAAEASVPLYQNDHGFGGFVKGMYGIGQSAQLTLMTGVSGFRSKRTIEQITTNTRLIPILAGYKQNFHKFYIEPQAGYGELGGNIHTSGDYARPSVAAFLGLSVQGMIIKKLILACAFSKRMEQNQLQQVYGMIKIFITQPFTLVIIYFDTTKLKIESSL